MRRAVMADTSRLATAFNSTSRGLHLAAVTYTQVMNGVPSVRFPRADRFFRILSARPCNCNQRSLGTGARHVRWGVQATPTLSFKVLGDPTTTIQIILEEEHPLCRDSFTFQLTGGYPSTSATYALTLNNAYQGILSGGTTDRPGL